MFSKYLTVKLFLVFVLGLCFECTCNVLGKARVPQKEEEDVYSVTIRMPQAVPSKADDLLCHAVQLKQEEAYILKFEPHATKNVAHHMMVYGCSNPGSDRPYWSCGEMDDHSNRSVCGDGERQIVWAWAMDADGRSFPKDVGFRVGGRSNINYIVIQLHYAEQFEAGHTDNSGVTLYITDKPQKYQAGYFVMYTFGFIPPMTKEFHMETACEFNKNYTIIPLAYRTHSHNLGVVTSGYRVRNGTWVEIGRMSPQLPQTFYDASNEGLVVRKGDILASRCTMSSQRKFFTQIGPQHKDEMCNFYIMYYTDYEDTLQIEYCQRDAQSFRWADYLTTPPESASSIEGIPSFTRDDPFAIEDVISNSNEENLM
ncbi:peptidylglycine alpha-hydroxylating monooxygenase-like [Ruditapes philippinarum]|uniref:peptidylglycine alpha-hydroxylating monooxygenase-like n=1 Tax=Ruditapes philippinarum TaxID=129788 RepID=UPI00295BC458|nr:peptidylglycine alpha-hydroxylating monooxygenase-like [Ruditapes philippinarum]